MRRALLYVAYHCQSNSSPTLIARVKRSEMAESRHLQTQGDNSSGPSPGSTARCGLSSKIPFSRFARGSRPKFSEHLLRFTDPQTCWADCSIIHDLGPGAACPTNYKHSEYVIRVDAENHLNSTRTYGCTMTSSEPAARSLSAAAGSSRASRKFVTTPDSSVRCNASVSPIFTTTG